jgi:hypothetical protein
MDKLINYVDANLLNLIIVVAVVWLMVAAWVMATGGNKNDTRD